MKAQLAVRQTALPKLGKADPLTTTRAANEVRPAGEEIEKPVHDGDSLIPKAPGFSDGERLEPEAHRQFGAAAFELGQPQVVGSASTHFTHGLQHFDAATGRLDKSTPVLHGVAVLAERDDVGFAWYRREGGVDLIAYDPRGVEADQAQLETLVRERVGDPSLQVRIFNGIPKVDAKRIAEATALVSSLAAGLPVTGVRVQEGRDVTLTLGLQFSPGTTPEAQASILKELEWKLGARGYQDVQLEQWGPIFSDKPEHATAAAARLNEAMEKRSFTGWPVLLLNAPRMNLLGMSWSYQFVPNGGRIELRSQFGNPYTDMLIGHMKDAFRQLGLPNMVEVVRGASN